MGFFKNKEEMFKHRANQFDKSAKTYAKNGNNKKEDWAREQANINREKAVKYKGEKGWD
ncbi:hypothetical protein ACFPFV_11630 [Salinicoccus siamensis]|uniref:Uncharacterized protein n=1 Tax=Salinicoccus siamensis TaxID=381830 RepID=A0ABV5Z4G5_9STAP